MSKRPISSVKGYIKALKNFKVKEVSENLILNTPKSNKLSSGESIPALAHSTSVIGYAGTNTDLYLLLELNRRYKNDANNSKNNDSFLRIPAKAFAALYRIIGYDSNTKSPLTSSPEQHFYVYDLKSSSGKIPQSVDGRNYTEALKLHIPTLSTFNSVLFTDLVRYSIADGDNLMASKFLNKIVFKYLLL